MTPDGATVRERRVLQLGRPGVRRADEEEQPGAVAATGGEEGVERVAPRYGLAGERIRERAPPRAARERRGRYAVEPMSHASVAITRRPASRAYADTVSKARHPSLPSASKKAACGLTATT